MEGGGFPPKKAEFAPKKLDFAPPDAAPATLTFRASADSVHPQPFDMARQPLLQQYSFQLPQPPIPPAAHPAIAPLPSQSPQLPPPKTNGNEGKDRAAKKKKQCNCKHSKCLKLYCECFAAGIYCDGCKCVNCHNNVDNETSRREAVETTLERNPFAFRPKIACGQDAVQDHKQEVRDGVVIEKHSKGCACKKSGCLKKYCECFQANILCSNLCKCVDCKNFEGSEERRTLSHRDHASNNAYMQQTANAAISGAIGSSGPPLLFKKRKGQELSNGSTANDPLNILGFFQKTNPVKTSLLSSASTTSGTHLSNSSGMGASKFSYRSLLADIIGPQDLKDLCSVLVVCSAEAKILADERSALGRPTKENRENHLASTEDELHNQKVCSVTEKASLNGCLNGSQSDDITPEESGLDGADVSKGRPMSPGTLALMCDEQGTMFTTVASTTSVSGQSDMSSQLPSAEGLTEVFSEQERIVLTRFRDCLNKLSTLGDIKEMKYSFAQSESGNKRDAMTNVNGSDRIDALNQP